MRRGDEIRLPQEAGRFDIQVDAGSIAPVGMPSAGAHEYAFVVPAIQARTGDGSRRGILHFTISGRAA